ncbi:MAG: hypothetical protein J5764_03770 [Bacteroidales bacterium]|nr:hypothetical protein [Bacteroidales bacterium]
MRYFIRSVKYFVYLFVILSLLITILIAMNLVESDPSKIFVNGKDSLWQIALLMAAFAGIYPKFGYCSRELRLPGSFEELRGPVVEFMSMRGYKLCEEDGENLTFRRRAPFDRLVKMFEDKLRFTRTVDGWKVEGISKEVIRCCSGLQTKLGE